MPRHSIIGKFVPGHCDNCGHKNGQAKFGCNCAEVSCQCNEVACKAAGFWG